MESKTKSRHKPHEIFLGLLMIAAVIAAPFLLIGFLMSLPVWVLVLLVIFRP